MQNQGCFLARSLGTNLSTLPPGTMARVSRCCITQELLYWVVQRRHHAHLLLKKTLSSACASANKILRPRACLTRRPSRAGSSPQLDAQQRGGDLPVVHLPQLHLRRRPPAATEAPPCLLDTVGPPRRDGDRPPARGASWECLASRRDFLRAALASGAQRDVAFGSAGM